MSLVWQQLSAKERAWERLRSGKTRTRSDKYKERNKATRQKDLEKALLEDIKKYFKKHDQKWSGKTHKKLTLNNYKKYIHVS